MPKKYYTIPEAAEIIGASIPTIRNFISSGKLQAIELTHGLIIKRVISQRAIEDFKYTYGKRKKK